MLSIAVQTFTYMDRATKETVNTILKTSDKQIEQLKGSVDELKNTNTILGNVSGSLKIVSEDVVSRQKLIPNLFVTFIRNQSQISLKVGDISEIEFYLHNGGVINASNPHWAIFLPPHIEIVEKGDFKIVPQRSGTRHENYNMIAVTQRTINARTRMPNKLKIRTALTNIGLVEIPFACSCDNAPQSEDKLLINYIG